MGWLPKISLRQECQKLPRCNNTGILLDLVSMFVKVRIPGQSFKFGREPFNICIYTRVVG